MTRPLPIIKHAWWKESTVYQIYPASFLHSGANSTGWVSPDGLAYGDIKGIISKLDYIANLGIDIIWLSPILKSPQVDMGYDISDYKQIDERYGSMEDHDELIAEMKKRGMRYVMDLVVNHTSDQHEWFRDSKAKKNGKEDWYIWRKARYDVPGFEGKRMPPNNWESAFSGEAWTWDEGRQEYYLHLFAKEQPDLNWEKDEVREAVYDVMRFWLGRGVSGFRMDVINFISKTYNEDGSLPDGDVTKPGFVQGGWQWFACGPRLHEYFQAMGKILKEFDAFSVGEMPAVRDEREILKAVGQDTGELAMAFIFDIVSMDIDPNGQGKWWPRRFEPKFIKEVIGKWQRVMIDGKGWNSLFMENHDQGRSVSRYTSDEPEYRQIGAKMLAAHVALQSGTVFCYQGQELGMVNVPREWGLEEYKDIECLNHWKTVERDYPTDEKMQKMFKDQYRLIGRDNARTPMQWTSGEAAGFVPGGSGLKPWMNVHPDHKEWNAEALVKREDSSYHFWKRLLGWRKKEKNVIVYGDFELLDVENKFPDVVAYVRRSEGRKAIVVTSFTKEGTNFELPKEFIDVVKNGVVDELRNYPDGNVELKDAVLKLQPFEVLVAVA